MGDKVIQTESLSCFNYDTCREVIYDVDMW